MSVYIHHIATALPPYVYRQDYARDRMAGRLSTPRARRMARAIYDRSGIERRYSVLPDFSPGADALLFREDAECRLSRPSTRMRNDVFVHASRELCVQAAQGAVEATTTSAPNDITHVITVSCTGFSNPGPDLEIVRRLRLPETVERHHVGFMGCYAAFPALRMARQFCRADPGAVGLVVCAELCSLHLQVDENVDNLLANALFADGVAAALVSARPPAGNRPALRLETFRSAVAPEGRSDMAWQIGDHGFDIRLSSYVPDIIAGNIRNVTAQVLSAADVCVSDISTWAVHPGGRSILDKVEKEMRLQPWQIAASRSVLRDFGNMSSATILFVLQRILQGEDPTGSGPVLAMSFGPGLTIETGVMMRVTNQTRYVEKAHEYAALV